MRELSAKLATLNPASKILLTFIVYVLVVILLRQSYNGPEPQFPEGFVPTAKVQLYSTEWCGYCSKAKRFFAAHHIPYEEWDIEKDQTGRLAYEQLGGGSIPLIVIGEQKVIRGYDPEALVEALSHTP